MNTPRDNFETALALADLGVACIPCRPGTKEAAVRWKEWQASVPPRELLERWFLRTRNNIAMVCTGLVVFDCDDPEKEQLVIARAGDTPVKTRTPRGGLHLPFRRRGGVELRNHVDVRGLRVDIRTDGGLALLPGSETADGRYVAVGRAMHELGSLSELPVARIGWTRERRRKRPPAIDTPAVPDRYADAALRYEVRNVATAQEGTRNATLNRAAYSLGGLVAAGLLGRRTVETALSEAALAAGLGDREIAATLESGITAGMKRPRSV